MTDILARMADEMIINSWSTDVSIGLAALRAELVATTPALRNLLVTRLFAAQTELTAAVHRTLDVDEIEAAALVGGIIGAANAAALASMKRGDSPDGVGMPCDVPYGLCSAPNQRTVEQTASMVQPGLDDAVTTMPACTAAASPSWTVASVDLDCDPAHPSSLY